MRTILTLANAVFLIIFFFYFLHKYRERIRLKNAKIYTTVIHDSYYDYVTDNDELDDPSTYSKVTFTEYGRVLNVERVDFGYGKEDELLNRDDLSRFYQVFGVDPRCMTNNESMRFSAYRDTWRKFI